MLRFDKFTNLSQAFELEQSCYLESEAATLEQMQYRFSMCPELFLGAYFVDKLVGLVMATLTTSKAITESSMKVHEPEGDCLCIHSVCVDVDFRRQGIATKMLKHYLNKNRYNTASIIVHEDLIPLYEMVGFRSTKQSDMFTGPKSGLKWNTSLILDVNKAYFTA